MSGPDASYFAIESGTGIVRLTDNPSYASKNVYNFTVHAHDAAGNITSKELTLNVVDKMPPVITPIPSLWVAENSGTYQPVYTVTSSDETGVSFSIKQGLSDDAGQFTIDASTGLVRLIPSPDFETQAQYQLTVVATDAFGNSEEQLVVLNIDDLHTGHANLIMADGTVVYDSEITTNINTPTIRISAPPLSTVEIFDGEISLGTFTAGSDPASSTFTLPELADGVHNIYYQYTPVGGGEGTTSDRSGTPLSITIDSTPPSITSSSTATAIDENSGAGQVVYTATSSDASAIYSLSGEDASYFSIESSTGVVTLTDNPDYETKNVYVFTLHAIDDNSNISEQLVRLSINNEKPAKPALFDGNNVIVDDGYTTIAAPRLGGFVAPGSTVQLFIDDVVVDTGSNPIISDSVTGAWSHVLVNPISIDGAYSVSIEATPDGGVAPELSESIVLTIDAMEDAVRALWGDGEYIIDVLGRKDIGPSDSAISLADPTGRPLSDSLSGAWNGIGVMKWGNANPNIGYYRMLQIGERGRRKGHYRIAELSSDGVVQSWGTWVTPTQAVADGYQELFDIDLNGDGQTSVPSFDANGDGFVDGLGHYVLTDGTSQVNLTDYRGRIFSTGPSTRWKALQAEKTVDGFDILIQGTGRRNSSRYQVLTTNHNGDLLTNTRWTKGDVLMRQGFESFFDKDLNGDSFIGAPPALDRDSNGLVDDVTNYALIKKGVDSSPDLSIELTNSRGRFLSDSSSRAWNVIHAAEDGSEFKILAQGERGRRRSVPTLDGRLHRGSH